MFRFCPLFFLPIGTSGDLYEVSAVEKVTVMPKSHKDLSTELLKIPFGYETEVGDLPVISSKISLFFLKSSIIYSL